MVTFEEVTFDGNSKILPLPSISLLDHISKVCLTNATTKKLQESKSFIKTWKVWRCWRTAGKKHQFYLQFINHGFEKFIWYGNAWNRILPAFFFDNLQKTLKKLVWKHMKFYTMAHYITSSTTRNISAMNCQTTSLKDSNKLNIHASFIFYAKVWLN